jgi:hypothetical protein
VGCGKEVSCPRRFAFFLLVVFCAGGGAAICCCCCCAAAAAGMSEAEAQSAGKGKRPSNTAAKTSKKNAEDSAAAATAPSSSMDYGALPAGKRKPRPTTLQEALEQLDEKEQEISILESAVSSCKEKHKELHVIGAKRLIQVAGLEVLLEAEREKNKELAAQLDKQQQMMDMVISFRDQECARDVTELTHENMELAEKLETWRQRAQALQKERWGFVQKFRAAKNQAFSGDGNAGFDSIAKVESESEDEEEDPDDSRKDSDDDW